MINQFSTIVPGMSILSVLRTVVDDKMMRVCLVLFVTLLR